MTGFITKPIIWQRKQVGNSRPSKHKHPSFKNPGFRATNLKLKNRNRTNPEPTNSESIDPSLNSTLLSISALSGRVWRQMHVKSAKQRPQPLTVSSRPPTTAALPAIFPTSPITKRPVWPPKLAELCTKQEKRYKTTTTTSTVKPRSRKCF